MPCSVGNLPQSLKESTVNSLFPVSFSQGWPEAIIMPTEGAMESLCHQLTSFHISARLQRVAEEDASSKNEYLTAEHESLTSLQHPPPPPTHHGRDTSPTTTAPRTTSFLGTTYTRLLLVRDSLRSRQRDECKRGKQGHCMEN